MDLPHALLLWFALLLLSATPHEAVKISPDRPPRTITYNNELQPVLQLPFNWFNEDKYN